MQFRLIKVLLSATKRSIMLFVLLKTLFFIAFYLSESQFHDMMTTMLGLKLHFMFKKFYFILHSPALNVFFPFFKHQKLKKNFLNDIGAIK
jgi:hypothetical protein